MPAVVETELAHRDVLRRRAAAVSPHQVATAVADVIASRGSRPFVPGYAGLLPRLLALLPQRGRDLMYRRLVPDQIAAGDLSVRKDYEQRHLG